MAQPTEYVGKARPVMEGMTHRLIEEAATPQGRRDLMRKARPVHNAKLKEGATRKGYRAGRSDHTAFRSKEGAGVVCKEGAMDQAAASYLVEAGALQLDRTCDRHDLISTSGGRHYRSPMHRKQVRPTTVYKEGMRKTPKHEEGASNSSESTQSR